MKKVMVLVLSIAVALAFASMVLAQSNPPRVVKDSTTTTTTTTTSKPIAKPATTTTTTTTTTKTVAPKERMIKGTVVSVDAVANTIVVKYKDSDKTFTLDPAAKIMIAGKESQLADIQKDAKVTVVYKYDEKKRVALAIK